jgi:hypothetical protein
MRQVYVKIQDLIDAAFSIKVDASTKHTFARDFSPDIQDLVSLDDSAQPSNMEKIASDEESKTNIYLVPGAHVRRTKFVRDAGISLTARRWTDCIRSGIRSF